VNPRSRTRVIVIFGGESAEHDVSCVTAAHVLRALDPQRYEVTTIGISRTGEWMLADAAMAALARGPEALPDRLEASGRASSLGEVIAASNSAVDGASNPQTTVVLPLLHGPMGEDGTVQGLLELAHVAYVGAGVLGSAVSMDKATTKRVLAAEGIAQPGFVALREDDISEQSIAAAVARLGLPMFVKPANMGSSVGVTKAKTAAEALAAARAALAYDEWVLCEEAVVGREIEVSVLGNREPRASVAGEIIPGREFYDYADKAHSCWCPPRFLRPKPRQCATWRCGCFARCGPRAWSASTSSTRKSVPTEARGAGSCATKSTPSRVSRRSRCIQSCGRPRACRTRRLSTS